MEERQEGYGPVTYFLRVLKPCMVAVFCPAAVFLLFSGGFIGMAWLFLANAVTSVPHEAGHFTINGLMMVFGILRIQYDLPFWMFVLAAAGTVGYTLPPILLATYYIYKKDALGVGAYLGFLAVSLNNMSSYVSWTLTADYMQNRLGTIYDMSHHDWYAMLTYLNALDKVQMLQTIFHYASYLAAILSLAMLAAFVYLKIREKVQRSRVAPPEPVF
jgi:hypothetical protein